MRSRVTVYVAGAILGLMLAGALGGCVSTKNDFSYDKNGWGGADLKYVAGPDGIQLDSGLMVNRDFRWAGGEVSFEFLDRPDIFWGIYFLDLTFRAERRAKITGDTQLVHTQDGTFVGMKLPKSQYWTLWPFDKVMRFVFCSDGTTKIMEAEWYTALLEDHLTACRASSSRPADIQPGWNTMRIRIENGQCAYWLNGKENVIGTIRIDSRYNGQFGFFVKSGGPLLIRNLQMTPAKGK